MSNIDKDIWKEKLEQGFADLTPDCWDEIRQSIPAAEQTITATAWEEQSRTSAARRLIPAIAVLAAVLICCFTFILKDIQTIEELLYLDVNPSICIGINGKGNVVKVDGINDDGKRVVEAVSAEIAGKRDLDETVRCVLAEIDKEGYFSDGSLDVLVSLSYKHQEDSKALERACNIIKEYARSRNLTANLLSQSFLQDKAIDDAAADIGISAGKYEYLAGLTEEDNPDKETILEMTRKPAKELIHSNESETEEKPADTASEDKITTEEKADDTQKVAEDNDSDKGNSEESSVNNSKSSKEKAKKSNKGKKNSKKKAKKNKKTKKNNSNNGKGKGKSASKNNKGKSNKNNNKKNDKAD